MGKYTTLVQVLDALRKEAPTENRRYHAGKNEIEKINNARSRAFIHLYLKVKFGILDFSQREKLITDDKDDGGIDAYYIDQLHKTVHVIQAKFRTNEQNFEEKQIDLDDLVKMEIDEIVKGDENGSNGRPYNGKIKQLQRDITNTRLISQYKYKIVILANFKTHKFLAKMYKDYDIEIFDYEKSYSQLVFPVISGTYFKAGDLHISINLDNTSGGNTRVSYTATTSDLEANVTLIFAPVREIGAMMSKYRNSILEYNPRSYLGLSKNPVNSSIASTITESTTNEFALFNNGITIVADEAGYSDKTGKKGIAHLDLVNPQIINGGQTAYTLCKIHDDVNQNKIDASVFKNKEVLLKIITVDPEASSKKHRQILIEKISRATNHQTNIDDADRRSNEKIQIELQKLFYEKYGLFYERKAGEFFDGIDAKYIDKKLLVDREQLMRVALAESFRISETRAQIHNFFSAEAFYNPPLNEELIDKYAFGYACFQYLSSEVSRSRKEKKPYYTEKFGTALRYGRYGVVSVALNQLWVDENSDIATIAKAILYQWKDFEINVRKKKINKKYFTDTHADWVSYYKGDTINKDISTYRFKSAKKHK